MRMRVGIVCLALAGLLCAGAPAAAGPLTGLDVPSNLLVMRGGLEFAWVAPCAPDQPSCGATLDMHHNFRVVETADWLLGFTDLMDVYNAFNPVGASQLCASEYFNSGYSHCDAGDLYSGYAHALPVEWGGQARNLAEESFVVRGEGVASVPDAGSSLFLMGVGLAGLAWWKRR
jgi:hypothetical protein